MQSPRDLFTSPSIQLKPHLSKDSWKATTAADNPTPSLKGPTLPNRPCCSNCQNMDVTWHQTSQNTLSSCKNQACHQPLVFRPSDLLPPSSLTGLPHPAHVTHGYLPKAPAGQTSLLGSGLGAAATSSGQVTLLILSSVMQSQVHFTGCPVGSPVHLQNHSRRPSQGPWGNCRLDTPCHSSPGSLRHAHHTPETWDSISEPLLWAQSRERQLPTTITGSPSHLLLQSTPCGSRTYGPERAPILLSSLQTTSGKGMEPVKGKKKKINTPSTHSRKCQTPFSGRERCCWPSSPAPRTGSQCAAARSTWPFTGCAPSPPGRGFSCSLCRADPSRVEPRAAEGCAGGRR